MKARILVVVSFGLNIVLLAGWWMGRPTPQTNLAKEPATNKVAAAHAKEKNSKTATRTVTVVQDKDLDWASVESEDYRKYIENLRAIGCPEETIRDIIIADINKLYASKIAALYPTSREMKFWRVNDRTARNEEKDRDKKRHELVQEKHELIKELLGIDYEAELARNSGRPTDDDWRYGFLSPEKQEQAKVLHDKYREMERDLFKDGGGWTPENRAKYAALRAQREAEMVKVLGSDYEEYELRNSWTGRHMRDDLAAFQPNEDEFRKVFQLRKSFDDQWAFTRDGSDDTVREQRKQAQQQYEDQLKGMLGEDRFREYQLSQDERYRDIYDFAQRNDLPRQMADAVYGVRLAAEQEKQRIQTDPNLTPDAQKQALQDLVLQTGTALANTLGKDKFANYTAQDGRWLARLDRPSDGGGDGRGSHGHNHGSH